ncbi:hypothetical protein DNU06_11930 [Putridiphycobacter roseus]|uniref:LTD domain-containing protein n=1 Tax=Putridiphycobacter roseus TaxID=2219161 RepID=A0A2W1NER9_9FLAO|nr:CotH kinase family protein [Putridiphycobacter roseus]PZE16556.1 hypothetical protein DNU06_11930 [Putridiphycobacter roseus]
MLKWSLYFLSLCLVQSTLSAQKLKYYPTGGKFEAPVYVKLVADSAESIYYTLDGSAPHSGTTLYVDSIYVQDVAVIRAVAYQNGVRSKVKTQSYFCDRAYDLPIISIVSEPGNFWSYDKGIFEKGCCADSTMPYYGANFWKSWEYECNVELYSKKGKKCFNQLAGMSLFGGYSRMLPQKSLAIIARSKYGKKRFEYPIFKERKNKKYKSFIIRNSGGDFKRTQLRDAFMTQLAKPTGVAVQAYEPAIVFINGRYWGIQNLREKISEHYLAANFDVDKDKVDILRHNGVKRHGYSTQYKFLLKFLRTQDLTLETVKDSLGKFMDLHDYIRYNISEVYSDNKDAGGNIRYFKERKPKAKWRWIFYDLDMGLSNDDRTGYASNTLGKFTTFSNEKWPNPGWSTFIIRTLLQNEDLKVQYINTFSDYLNTYFHADTALRLWHKMSKKIENEIPYHQKRWGANVKNWEDNLAIVEKFVRLRPEHLWQHLKIKFELDTTVQIEFTHPGDSVCDVTFNSLQLKESYSGLYFKGIPQTIKVKPKHDYELIGWEGLAEKTEKIVFTADQAMQLKPIIVAKDSSEYRHQIIINEVSFNQVDSDTTGDWIELYNRSNESVDLYQWRVTDRSFKKGYVIEEHITLKPNDLLVIGSTAVNGFQITDLNFGLSKKGEQIKVYDANGFLVDVMKYNNEFAVIDSSFSLALIHVDSLGLRPDNWVVEAVTPGMDNNGYLSILETLKFEKEAKERQERWLMIGGVALTVFVLLFIFIRRRKKKVVVEE